MPRAWGDVVALRASDLAARREPPAAARRRERRGRRRAAERARRAERRVARGARRVHVARGGPAWRGRAQYRERRRGGRLGQAWPLAAVDDRGALCARHRSEVVSCDLARRGRSRVGDRSLRATNWGLGAGWLLRAPVDDARPRARLPRSARDLARAAARSGRYRDGGSLRRG